MAVENTQDIKQFYNSSDLYFDICENRPQESFQNIVDVINQYVPKGAKLLEFGCGTGNLAALVAKDGYDVLGVDISERFIAYSKDKYGSKNLDFQVVGFGTLPFADKSYDCIYTCAVLEHCYEVDKIIADFNRLLKPGGTLVIATPNLLSPFTRLSLVAKRLMGKRKRYHLYGTPSYLFKSIGYNLQKALSAKPQPIYVTPKYDDFGESDEDVTFLSNHYDFLAMLKPMNYTILELARGGSGSGKVVAKMFPRLSGEVLIVARKNA